MRKTIGKLFMLTCCLSGSALAGPCGLPDPHAPPHSDDLSWVESRAVVYGGGNGTGAFRITLGESAGPQPIGNHARDNFDDVVLSHTGRLVAFVGSSHNRIRTLWLYDASDGEETVLRPAPPYGLGLYFSPNDDFLYWPLIETGAVEVINLASHRRRVVRLAGVQPGSTAILNGAWSDRGNELIYTGDAGKQHYALDLGLSESKTIDDFNSRSTLAPRVNFEPRRVQDGEVLERGAAAVIDERRIFIRRVGVPDETIAELPIPGSETPDPGKCIAHALGIWGTLDNRYVIYNQDDRIWIYGLREDRKAILVDSNYATLKW